MNDTKFCVRCGKIIATENTADWYAYIRMKYCDECRTEVKRAQTAARARRFRWKKHLEKKVEKTQLELLQEKNAELQKEIYLLRKYNLQLRERID